MRHGCAAAGAPLLSAIAGIRVLHDRGSAQLELAHIAEKFGLQKQSPDIWVNNGVAFAQGAGSETLGPLIVTADVRLDNRDELLAALGWPRPSVNIPDARILLGCYERWGTDCSGHLLGDFAFSIWDPRQQIVFCARDHLGIRPFYYMALDGLFAFASEIKALLTLPWVPHTLNTTRVIDYLMQMGEDPEATFYADILRLPPAHSLTVDADGRMRKTRYWMLDELREIRYESDAQYSDTFRELFHDAVKCRLRDAHPIASMLSGGFDSSSITCVARDELATSSDQHLKTFSLVFDDIPVSNERRYIEAVLDEGSLEPYYVRGDRIPPLRDLDEMLGHLDEPFITPNLFLYWELYRQAQGAGVRTMLDGFMGDNVVSHGRRYLTELAAAGRWRQLAREVRAENRARSISSWQTYAYLLSQYVALPLLLEPLTRAWASLTSPPLPATPQSRYVNAGFAAEIDWIEKARAFGKDLPRTPKSARAEHLQDLRSGCYSHVYEVIAKASSAFNLSVRLPFTDRRLVEYCLAVPARQKYRNGRTRVYARRGLHNDLPEMIRRRYSKRYLGEVLRRGVLDLDRDEVRSLVMGRLPIAAEFVNVEAVQEAFQNLGDNSGQGAMAFVSCVWPALILTRWLERNEENGQTNLTSTRFVTP